MVETTVDSQGYAVTHPVNVSLRPNGNETDVGAPVMSPR